MKELEQTEEFKCLTPKQQLFVRTYVEGGLLNGNYDPVGAALTAYNCKSRENARVMSYSLLEHLSIVEVLSLHFARSPKEEFLQALNRAIRNKRFNVSQLKALQMKAQVLGLTNRLPGADSTHDLPLGVIPPDVVEHDKTEAKEHRKDKRPNHHKKETPAERPKTDLDREAANF